MTIDAVGPNADPVARKREQRGWYFYDWANSTFYTSVITVFGAVYISALAAEDAKGDQSLNGPTPCVGAGGVENELVNCDIEVLGLLTFPAGSLWGYLIAFTTILQVLVLPITGAIADRSQNKRQLLGGAAVIGSLATAGLMFAFGSNWGLALILYVIAQLAYGASIVVYYSFLPEIATADERDHVSTRGWAFGYLGGGIALALQLVLFLSHEAIGISEGLAVRLCFVSSGIWWAAFTVVTLRRLRQHQAPHGAERGASVITAGFSELGKTLREAKAFPLTLAFLGTYLVFNDGIQTVVTVSAQYGTKELKFDQEVLIVTILVIQFVAFFGGLLHGVAARYIGPKKTIMTSLVLWILVIIAAYFLRPGDKLAFWAVAAGIGLVLGGTVALSRSLYSQMIPPGKEAQYFSLYEISERGTAWLGPLLFAGIAQATGSYRPAILAVIVFFVLGFILVALVPIRRAIQAVGNPEPSTV